MSDSKSDQSQITPSTNQSQQTSPVLSEINIYPVKSVTGIAQSVSWVEMQGLACDRRFMVADMQGKMITARENNQMVRIKAALQANGLVLTYPEVAPLQIKFSDCTMEPVYCQVWKDQFEAYTTSSDANKWFSYIIGKPVQLLFTGEQSNRQREKISTNVSFADGYPFLLISQGALDELNERSTKALTMAQFRPNLVVSGCKPFAEDGWKRIQIGEVEFEIMKPCMRCILTTVNPQTAMRSEQNEPLKTLSTFRADNNGAIFFGQNMIAKNEGMIRSGDKVIVLERKAQEVYRDTRDETIEAKPVKKLTISINGNLFEGENQTSLLEQAEKAGLNITNSCRAGICGACKMTLESGKVDQPDMPALLTDEIEAGKVLACCCIPKSNVELID